MSLKEEIYRLVYNHNEEQYGKCEECEYRTDLIIKIIEKVIDKHLKRVKQYDHYSIFALTELKKEMLK